MQPKYRLCLPMVDASAFVNGLEAERSALSDEAIDEAIDEADEA